MKSNVRARFITLGLLVFLAPMLQAMNCGEGDTPVPDPVTTCPDGTAPKPGMTVATGCDKDPVKPGKPDTPDTPEDKTVIKGMNAVFLGLTGTNLYDAATGSGSNNAKVSFNGSGATFAPTSDISTHAVSGAPTAGVGFFQDLGATDQYASAGGTIDVTTLHDIGHDGKSGDAFLMLSKQQLIGGGSEYGLGLGGADGSNVTVMKAERTKAGNVATYTGKGQYLVGISNTSVPVGGGGGCLPPPCGGGGGIPVVTNSVLSNSGTLTMDANFNTGVIAGKIVNKVGGQTVAAGLSPVLGDEFDRVEFTAKLGGKDSSTYEFDSLELKNGATTQTTFGAGKFGGTGTIYGTKAGGTALVFSGTGNTTLNNSDINVIGAATGKR